MQETVIVSDGDVFSIPAQFASSDSQRRWWEQPAFSGCDNPALDTRMQKGWRLYNALVLQHDIPDIQPGFFDRFLEMVRTKLRNWGIL